MNDEQHILPEGSIVGKYQIINILGEGGFGITYLAVDNTSGWPVVIKEYFPNEFAIRKDDRSIIAKTSSRVAFKRGLQRFKEEAKILSRFNHPAIVKILGYFTAHNTAYFVMEYEEGIDLARYLREHSFSPLSQEEILSILMPILEGLKEVHRHQYLHRDIKPANILIRDKKLPVLIDFGASKQALGEVSKSVTSVLTEGYAPLEQYSTDVKQQGPFTDLYAIGALMYRMITGKVPPSAQTRSYQLLQEGQDPLILLSEMNMPNYDDNFIYAIDRSLELKGKNRPQSVQEFQDMLMGKQYQNWNVSDEKEDILPPRTFEYISEEAEKNDKLSNNIFSFDGVIHRLGFLLHMVIAFLIFISGILLMAATSHPFDGGQTSSGISSLILSTILVLWVALAAIVKRSRDINQSILLFIFLSFIPYINFIIVLILLFVPGTNNHENEKQ